MFILHFHFPYYLLHPLQTGICLFYLIILHRRLSSSAHHHSPRLSTLLACTIIVVRSFVVHLDLLRMGIH